MSIYPRHSTWNLYDQGASVRPHLHAPRHSSVNVATHIPHPTQPGLWLHSHDPEHDLLKRYVVETRTPSGWLGVKSFDTTDSLAEWGFYNFPIGASRTFRIFDQKLGRAL